MRPLFKLWRVTTVMLGVVSLLRPAYAQELRSPPDTQTLDRLQARFHSGRSARLATLAGERILISPVFTLDGVKSEVAPGPVMVPWSEIERIDARGGHPGRGGLIGGLIGFGVGVGLGFAAALGDESGHGFRTWIGVTAVSTGAGAIGGAMLGALAPGGWSQVYPATRTGSAWGLERRK